jgi:hypothetical protein
VIDFDSNYRLYFDKSSVLFRDGNCTAGAWLTASHSGMVAATRREKVLRRKFYGDDCLTVTCRRTYKS